jgi:pimeloyl-ACP methyl ester carboxylesterase
MPKKTAKKSADYILPLYINGLSGRMLHLPAPRGKKREVLFIYGQHSSLERWWGLAMALNTVGAVTMPDLPGLGGMTSLYKIGLDGSIDDLADYLATFIKFRYKNKKITIFGMSLGFVVVTRMLQRYPDLAKKVETLISVVGFGHHEDFIFSRRRHFFYKYGSKLFSHKYPSLFFQGLFLRPFYLRRVYSRSHNAREKFTNISGDEFNRTMDMEIELWKANDLRTQMKTGYEMLSLDLTHTRINLPVYHIATSKDRYFDNVRVEEHLRKIYSDFTIFYTKNPNHAPTVIADAKAAAPFIPAELKRLMNQGKI